MDDIVMVGAAGILGLVLVAIVAASAVIWVALLLYAAFLSGDWMAIGRIISAIIVVAGLYIGTGLVLKKAGHI